MKTAILLSFGCTLLSSARAEVTAGTYDLAAVRDASTLETRVIQDWKPWGKDSAIRQKLIEITVWVIAFPRFEIAAPLPVVLLPFRDSVWRSCGSHSEGQVLRAAVFPSANSISRPAEACFAQGLSARHPSFRDS